MERARSSTETIRILRPLIKKASITRVSNLSGLDDSSCLKVYSAIRPLAKSLSVSMGKSLNSESAKCGAIMESLEAYFSEELNPSFVGYSKGKMRSNNLKMATAKNQTCNFGDNYPLDWCEGRIVTTNNNVYFPTYLISLNSNQFINQLCCSNSNGLGAGNNFEEALVSGIFEQIERISLVNRRMILNEPRGELIQKYKIRDDYLTRYFVFENEFCIPVVRVEIFNKNKYANQCIYFGTCASYSYKSALMKALEEAIQSKVGVISGGRDDLIDAYYDQRNVLIDESMGMVRELYNEINPSSYTNLLELLIHMISLREKKVGYVTLYDDEVTILKVFLLDCENNIL